MRFGDQALNRIRIEFAFGWYGIKRISEGRSVFKHPVSDHITIFIFGPDVGSFAIVIFT